MRTTMLGVGLALVLLPVVAAPAAAAPVRPHERTLTWQCTDGTSFTAVRPSFAANASPVVGSTAVWLQRRTTVTTAEGEVFEKVWGAHAPGTAGSDRLLECSTLSGTNRVDVVGLLVGG